MKKFILITLYSLISTFVFSQTDEYIAAHNKAEDDAKNKYKCTYNSSRNYYVDQNDVIHVFIFEDGNLLLQGYPTTATEKNKFQIHLYLSESNIDKYLLDYSGSFTPDLNVQGSDPDLDKITVAVDASNKIIKTISFAIIGPFTNNLQLTIKRKLSGTVTYFALTTTTIQISKTIHASIGSGLIYTGLENPSNIRKIPLSNTIDSTLIADDINGRGLLTLSANFYPWGRNSLLLPEWNFKDRLGIVVGTTIGSGSSNFKDFFLGLSYDFFIGGSLVAGAHYGRRQSILNVNYSDFKFGETKFDGNLDELKHMTWDLSYFFGIQVDNRVFKQLFK